MAVAAANRASAVTAALAMTRQAPRATSANGSTTPRCGLNVSRPISTPDRIGRRSMLSTPPRNSAALRKPFWPPMALIGQAGVSASSNSASRRRAGSISASTMAAKIANRPTVQIASAQK